MGFYWFPCVDPLAVTSIQVYSSLQDSKEDTELTLSASIRYHECLYSWVWTSGPIMLITTGRYKSEQLYTC